MSVPLGGPIRAKGLGHIILLIGMLAICISGISGCGGDEVAAPEVTSPPPDETPLVIVGGSFDVQTTLGFDSCDLGTEFDSVYVIVIDSVGFWMGADWAGTWDAETLSGRAESVHKIREYRFCTLTSWTTVDITFLSEDEFYGHIVHRRRAVGDCTTSTPCLTSWWVGGTRR
jgi:hypothetical protein